MTIVGGLSTRRRDTAERVLQRRKGALCGQWQVRSRVSGMAWARLPPCEDRRRCASIPEVKFHCVCGLKALRFPGVSQRDDSSFKGVQTHHRCVYAGYMVIADTGNHAVRRLCESCLSSAFDALEVARTYHFLGLETPIGVLVLSSAVWLAGQRTESWSPSPKLFLLARQMRRARRVPGRSASPAA